MMKALPLKRSIVTGLIGLVLLIFAPLAFAGEVRSGENVHIAADELIENNLYVFATTFVLDGVVKGDVLVAAQTITLNGSIEGDLIAAAQTITLNGTISDDARLGATAVILGPKARVGDNLSTGAYSLETRQESRVEGDLSFAGRQALLAGDIAQDVLLGAYGLALQGTVGGSLEASLAEPGTTVSFDPSRFIPNLPPLPSVAAGLNLGSNAHIGGNLVLSSPMTSNDFAKKVFGDVRFEEPSPTPTAVNPFWLHLRRYLALAVIGLVLLWLGRGFVPRAAEQLQEHPWTSLGFGAITLVGFPLALATLLGLIVLLAIALGLMSLGNLTGVLLLGSAPILLTLATFFGLTLTYLTQIVMAYFGGKWLLMRLNSEWAKQPYVALLIGLIIVVVLTTLPYFGVLVALAIVLFGLGALWLLWRSGGRRFSALFEKLRPPTTRAAMP